MSAQDTLLTRRRVCTALSTLAASAVTGCFSPQMGGPVDEIGIFNATDEKVEVLLEVYRAEDEKSLLKDRFALAADGGREYEQPFEENGRKRLEIVVDGDRRTSYEWEARAERDSTGVDINIQEDRIDIGEVAA